MHTSDIRAAWYAIEEHLLSDGNASVVHHTVTVARHLQNAYVGYLFALISAYHAQTLHV
jgi:hypothetical protein